MSPLPPPRPARRVPAAPPLAVPALHAPRALATVGGALAGALACAVAVPGPLAPAPAAAQAAAQATGTIVGVVIDSASRRPLANVQVAIPNTGRGALTGDAGTFAIRGVPAGPVTVGVSRLGFSPQQRQVTLRAGDTVRVEFALRQNAVQLSSVVTIGYGTASRQTVSSAIASVDSTTFAKIPVAAIDNALQGRIPGVQVMQNSGEPGAAVSVRVRGPASLNAGNQPLYVVDGIPIIQGNQEQITSTSGQRQSPISTLNPEEIERIDVLKDAAATAIYGSRGANGVVLITTKRGAGTGRMKFGLSAYGGSQAVERKVDLLNAREYVQVMNEARTNDNRPVRFAPGTDSIDVDWQDAIYRGAPVTDLQLNLSGGGERVRAFVSGANFQQRGIVVGSQYARQAARLNLDATPTSKLSVATSVSVTREDNDRVPGDLNLDGVVSNALVMQPFSPVRGQSFGFGGTREGLIYSNPVAVATYNSLENTTLRALGSLEARYTVVPRLTITGRVGGDLYGLDELRWRSPRVDRAISAGVGGQGASGRTNTSRYITEAFANFDALQGNRFGDLTLTAGTSAEWNESEWNYVAAQGFPTGFSTYIRNASQVVESDGSHTANTLVSYFSRANWTLKDRYLVSASLRTDGSSRFGTANRYGVFPAVSLGWTVSDEGWASALSRVGALKLRGSYGVTGNQGILDFASRTLAAAAPYNALPGLGGTQLGNPSLQWEQTSETDIGLDLTLLRGRLGIIADWYVRDTDNLLVQRPVPSTSGYLNVWDNVGAIRNRGIDLALHTENVQAGGNRPGWTTDFNITWNRNQVTELYNDQPITFTVSSRVTSVAAVGHPLGAFYLFRMLRVDPQTGNAVYARANGTETLTPTSADLQVVGNPQPNYYGGLTNTFTWRGLDLRSFFQFSQGGELLNLARIFMDDGGNVADNKSAHVLRRWQKPGDVTDVPRLSSNGASGARLLSSRFIEDGSFVRFGELTLGYRLPAGLVRNARLDNARVFVSGRNLATWTKYSGYNPDVNSNAASNVVMGVDFFAYPLARTWTLGLTAGW